jgi:hypothetical protein
VKKLLAFCIVVLGLALAGTVFAQDYDDNSGGGNTATVNQTVTIDIPNRVALHITKTSVHLDLNNLDDFDGACYLIRKDAIDNYTNFDAFIAAIDFDNPVSNYPAAVFDDAGNVAMDGDEYLKGALVCKVHKIIQKFSNYKHGWELAADVNIPNGSGIKFGIKDLVEHDPFNVLDGNTDGCLKIAYHWWWGWHCAIPSPSYLRRHFVSQTVKGLELDDATLALQRVGRTNGWLDDHIFEYFLFDGSEVAGSHAVELEFTLTGNP